MLAPWHVRYRRDIELAAGVTGTSTTATAGLALPTAYLEYRAGAQVVTTRDAVRATIEAYKPALDGPGPAPGVTDPRWPLLRTQLAGDDTSTLPAGAPGRFSFVEYNSGAGLLSLNVAHAYPDATVVSIDGSESLTDAHLAAVLRQNVSNNEVCRKTVDERLLKHFYESPEFVRYQVTWGKGSAAVVTAAGW